MAATAISLQVRPNRHHLLLLQNPTISGLYFFSSSSSNSPDNHQNQPPPPQPQPESTSSASSSSSYTALFGDVKASLKQSPPPLQQPPRSSFSSPNAGQPLSFDEIKKNLPQYGRSTSVQPPPSSTSPFSFQDAYKRTTMANAISESLRNIKPAQGSRQQPELVTNRTEYRFRDSLASVRQGLSPKSFRESDKGVDSDAISTGFSRMYNFEELGEKLRKLRPEVKGDKKNWFSLEELNERLKKLPELEEKEAKNEYFLEFKECLQTISKASEEEKAKEKAKKSAVHKINPFGQDGGQPSYMLSPPKESLVEKYFHPDHMSSTEKMKLELKKVRDKFKTSESDCGSTSVQVAQLTTKIKHLGAVLHKKDKHSRKGLQAMVQRRKKLLKYLRRTDWDSYCNVISELGLRDSPDYKT